ncbi:MAG TPA: TerB family tellurite resistance protein [Acidimicrobiales bacterium]
MILVWGWKVRFKTLAEGVFFCQVCGGDRHYHRKQGRRWFTLFWIPLIPLNHVGDEFVECTTCRNAYRTTVLNQPTSASLSESLVGATRAAIAWLLRTEPPGPQATAAALTVLTSAANRQWTEQELQQDIAHLDVSGLPGQLATLASVLNEHGRETFLAGCVRVAAADGTISDGERALLDNVASSLGMTPAHARGVIAQVSEQAGT